MESNFFIQNFKSMSLLNTFQAFQLIYHFYNTDLGFEQGLLEIWHCRFLFWQGQM